MIQRIQSVFLVLVVASLIAFMFSPVWAKQNKETGETHKQYSYYVEKLTDSEATINKIYIPYFIPGALALVAAFLTVISLLSYKKRKKQIVISSINSLLMGTTLILSAWWASKAEANVLTGTSSGYQYGLFLPAIALIFNSLAIRFIRKDEKLVRSMDRLR